MNTPTITGITRKLARMLRRKHGDVKTGYPQSGTGLRQGARLERQRAAGQLDFTATGKCLAAIYRRLAKAVA